MPLAVMEGKTGMPQIRFGPGGDGIIHQPCFPRLRLQERHHLCRTLQSPDGNRALGRQILRQVAVRDAARHSKRRVGQMIVSSLSPGFNQLSGLVQRQGCGQQDCRAAQCAASRLRSCTAM